MVWYIRISLYRVHIAHFTWLWHIIFWMKCWIQLSGVAETWGLDIHEWYSSVDLLLCTILPWLGISVILASQKQLGGFLFFSSSALGLFIEHCNCLVPEGLLEFPSDGYLGPCYFGDGSLIHFSVYNSNGAILVIYSSLGSFHLVGIFTLICIKICKIASFLKKILLVQGLFSTYYFLFKSDFSLPSKFSWLVVCLFC